MENYIDTNEVSKIIGYNSHTVRVMARQGILKAYRVGPKMNLKFKRSDIQKFMKAEKTVKYHVKRQR